MILSLLQDPPFYMRSRVLVFLLGILFIHCRYLLVSFLLFDVSSSFSGFIYASAFFRIFFSLGIYNLLSSFVSLTYSWNLLSIGEGKPMFRFSD